MLVAADGLSVFPNPASSKLNIHLGEQAGFTGEVVIRNVLGQLISSVSCSSIETLNIQNWTSGLYIVSASLKNGGSVQKMVRIGGR